MRSTLAAALILALSAAPAFAQTPADDEAGVRAALQHYLNGHATGDPEEFRKAFHPDARMTFVRDGKITITPISDYIGRASGKPAADEAKRARRITSIEVTGTAAVGRIELDYPSALSDRLHDPAQGERPLGHHFQEFQLRPEGPIEGIREPQEERTGMSRSVGVSGAASRRTCS